MAKRPTQKEIEFERARLNGFFDESDEPDVSDDGLKEESVAETKGERRDRWNHKWGSEYSEKDCEILDRTYDMVSAEYRGAITSRLELALSDISIFRLKRDKAVKAGDSAEAKRYQEMIDKVMAGEAMKAGDTKPVEALRPDALIDRLEKRGVTLYSQQEVVRYINGDKGAYNTSLDVVDLMMLLIENTMRANAGEAELTELPKSLQVEDRFHELKEKPTKSEARAMRDLGEVPPMREK